MTTSEMALPRRRARWRIVFVSSTRPNIRPLTGSGTRSSYSTPRRDITLKGTPGRPISVVIMIFGVTLFLRLVRALLQAQKVRFACPTCGLQRHDFDAVHCKACGTTLNIPDEGISA